MENRSIVVVSHLMVPQLSGSQDKTLKLWRTRDGSLINTLNGHTAWVTKTSLSSWFSCHTGLVLLFLT